MSFFELFLDLVMQTDGEPRPERFSGEWWAQVLIGAPLRIVVIVVAGLVVRWLLHRAIDRVVRRASSLEPKIPGAGKVAQVFLGDSGIFSERRALRAATMGSLFKSIATVVVLSIVAVMALAEAGVEVAPIIASAGILGVALGFGAQNLVKDFISGVFMLLEDQYGVGDVIDMGEAAGVVESVGLRVTRLRDVNGTVWYVRNGEVIRIGNQSQGWARAVVDVAVSYGSELPLVRELLARAASSLRDDPELAEVVLEDPEVWGVEQLSLDGVVLRVVVKTAPLQQWKVARELRERIKQLFDEHRVEIPVRVPGYVPHQPGTTPA